MLANACSNNGVIVPLEHRASRSPVALDARPARRAWTVDGSSMTTVSIFAEMRGDGRGKGIDRRKARRRVKE
eukprot:scaffold165040_cov27-Tisochrysis_lutea.AAC.4